MAAAAGVPSGLPHSYAAFAMATGVQAPGGLRDGRLASWTFEPKQAGPETVPRLWAWLFGDGPARAKKKAPRLLSAEPGAWGIALGPKS